MNEQTNRHVAEAIAHQRAGRAAEAIAAFERALGQAPDSVAALHGLGITLLSAGRAQEGEARLARAAALAPDEPVIANDHAAALRLLGRLDEAQALLARTTARAPRHAEAWHNLGMVELARGQPASARAALEQAVALAPDIAFGHLALGVALSRLGDFAAALPRFETAARLEPREVRAHVNQALTLVELDRAAEAAAPTERALALDPDNVDALTARAAALSARGDHAGAQAVAQRATTRAPDYPNVWNVLSVVLREAGDGAGAMRAARRAVELAPGDATPIGNLARAALQANLPEEALRQAARAIAIAPNPPAHHFARGRARQMIGDRLGALGDFGRLFEMAPCWPGAIDNLAFGLVEATGSGRAAELAAVTRRWAARCMPAARRDHDNDPDPSRRLRVGYVSPDLRRHSVAYFLLPLVEAHDAAGVEVHFFSLSHRSDEYTERFKSLPGAHWHRLDTLSDDDAAAAIARAGIDVLVDLVGLTDLNRIGIFARKPAPVQVSWLGWPATTGLAAIDWRFTDAIADPPGVEGEYAERLLRLADGFHVWRAPVEAPEASPRVSPPGSVVFGSFNHARKISDDTMALWARVLTAVPGSRLLLKSAILEFEGFRTRVRAGLQAAGIAPERIEMIGAIPGVAEHLACYGRVDVALDTFPYNGTTTTMEALWMGVPVLALRGGDRHAARVGESLLTHAGLEALIARDGDDYVALAAALAADEAGRRTLRAALRARLAGSPLCDGARFARKLEAAYRSCWRAWCDARRG